MQKRKSPNDAIAAPRGTPSRQHLLRGLEKAKSEAEADTAASPKVDLGGAKSRDGDDQAGPRRTQRGKHIMGRGRKRAVSEVVAENPTHEGNLKGDAEGGFSPTVSLEPIHPALNESGAEELVVSGECRPFKRRKSDRMTSVLKSVGAEEETNQAEAEVDVDEVEAEEDSKFNMATSKESGNVKEAAVRQPMKWKLELRPELKKILERDQGLVMKKGKRHRLPASPNINQLLGQFVKDVSLRRLCDLEKLQSK